MVLCLWLCGWVCCTECGLCLLAGTDASHKATGQAGSHAEGLRCCGYKKKNFTICQPTQNCLSTLHYVMQGNRTVKKRMQEANADTKFKKGQQDADFFKKLHKVSATI